jgi:hypothetical protein
MRRKSKGLITIDIFAKEIRKQFLLIDKGKRGCFKFLGFVELDDLTDEVESYFKEIFSGIVYYNWVAGNTELRQALKRINIKTKWQDIKKILKEIK